MKSSKQNNKLLKQYRALAREVKNEKKDFKKIDELKSKMEIILIKIQ